MKLKSYLNELSMKAKTNIEVHKSLGREYNAKITLSDGTTWLYNAVDYEGSGTFDIVFYAPSDSKSIPSGNKNKVALETFAAIEKITMDFIKYEDPDYITFNAHGKSKVKLYDLLAKKIVKSKKYRLYRDGGGKFGATYYKFEKVR